MTTHAIIVIGFLLLSGLAMTGCRGGEVGPAADYVFVILKSGPTSGEGEKAARAEMFKGHMANINRLALERRLVIAGPFASPRDKMWRGVLVLDVPTVAEALELAATDPGVQAGEFVPDAQRMRASPDLRRALDLEGEFQAERRANPSAPPPEIRKYVMVSTDDLERCRRELDSNTPPLRSVWSGWLIDEDQGLIVVDAESPALVEQAMARVSPRAGEVDGWYSTAALIRLPHSAVLWHK